MYPFIPMRIGRVRTTFPWWRHQMETFSALLVFCAGNSPVTGEFPSQRPMTQSFGVFFDLCVNKRLRKQLWGWWFETPSLWSYSNVVSGTTLDRDMFIYIYKSNLSALQWRHPQKNSAYLEITNTALYSHLKWRHIGGDGVPNHQSHDCLLNRIFRRISKKTSKLRVTGLCEGDSPVTGEFSTQMARNAENVSIWWRHHERHRVHRHF